MKKFILSLTLAVGCFAAFGQEFVARSFLADNQAVWMTNNTTTSYGDVNVGFTNASGQAVYSLTNLYSTNSLIAPGTIYTNQNIYYGQAWYDVRGLSDRNGKNSDLGIGIAFTGSTTRSTNTLTFTFVKMVRFQGSSSSLVNPPLVIPTTTTDTTNQLTLAIAGNSTNQVATTLLLPPAFVQGAAGFRLKSIVEADNGAAGGFYLQNCTLNGYTSVP